MVAVVATIRVREGREAEFERVFSEMTEKVKANEPGSQLYQLTRSRGEPRVYKVLEIYADQAAFDAHASSEHYKAGGARLRDLVEARPDIEVLDLVD